MPKLRVSLSDAPEGCAKPNCGHCAPLNRHHKAHEALWLGAWAHRGGEPKWKAFVQRYHEFREEDIVRLCVPHHAEIHSIYDSIIADDCAKTGLQLYLYSWKQGRILMQRLRDACIAWLQEETPGLDSQIYQESKALRRAVLQKNAKRRHPRKEGHAKLAKLRGKKLRNKRKRGPSEGPNCNLQIGNESDENQDR